MQRAQDAGASALNIPPTVMAESSDSFTL